MLKKYLLIFFSAVAAGLLIGVGGTAFLFNYERLPVGAFLFSVGLSSVIVFKLHLFTGKIGFVFENKPDYAAMLAVTFLGNFVGAAVCGYLLRFTRLDALLFIAQGLAAIKYEDDLFSVFILAVFCGMMIFIAVKVQSLEINVIWKVFLTVIPVMVFVLCSFEHCIANVFYFSFSASWTAKSTLHTLVTTLGNSIGSIILWFLFKCAAAINEKK